MKKSINFTATKNIVTADAYVPYALYAQNKAIVEELGGQVCKGNEGFVAQFPTATKAKAFVSQAICSMSKAEYNKARKTAPAPVKSKATAPKQGKGKFITLMDEDGNEYKIPMSALGIAPAPTTKATATKKTATTKTKQAPAPKTKPVAKGKGKAKSCDVDFSKLAGKGRAANSKASALINKAGYANNTPEYMAAWAVWCEVR